MNFRSAITHCGSLLRGDERAWRHVPYLLKMRLRGIDLRWTSLEDTDLSEEHCYRYSDSGGPDLEELLDTLTISQSDSVLDLGCGKGGALISLAKYPFARVDGVEISPELAQIAKANMRRLHISRTRIFCGDAAAFTALDEYTFFYMYNPFPQCVTRSVMQNIEASLRRRARRAILIYKNAAFHESVLNAGFRKVRKTLQTHPDYPPFFIYAADGPAQTSTSKWAASG